MARRISLEWGGGVPAVLLDLADTTGSRTVTVRDGHTVREHSVPAGLFPYGEMPGSTEAVHDRFGGKNYYSSRSGLSGAGYTFLPPSVVEVGTYDGAAIDIWGDFGDEFAGISLSLPLKDRDIDYGGYAVVRSHEDGSPEMWHTLVPLKHLQSFITYLVMEDNDDFDPEVVEWRETYIPAIGEDLREEIFRFGFVPFGWGGFKQNLRDPYGCGRAVRNAIRFLTQRKISFGPVKPEQIDPAALDLEEYECSSIPCNAFWRCMGVLPATDGWGYVLRRRVCRNRIPLVGILSSTEVLEQALPARGQAIIASGNEAMYLLVEEDMTARAVYLFIDEEGLQWDFVSHCTADETVATFAAVSDAVPERCRVGARERRAYVLAQKCECHERAMVAGDEIPSDPEDTGSSGTPDEFFVGELLEDETE